MKYRFQHLGDPTCLRKRRRFGLRHKPDFQHFRSIRALRTARLFRFKHRHHIRSAISIAVVNDEFRPSEDADQTREPNQEPGFLEHLADCGVGRNFSRLYCATWQKPDAAFRMTYHEHASLHIAQRGRHGRNLEQLVTSDELAETPDVLSHGVKVLRLADRDRAIYHHLAQRRESCLPRVTFNARTCRAKGDIVSSGCLHDSPDRVYNNLRLVDRHDVTGFLSDRQTPSF